jgi:phosphoribosyl 1,2-cyclic phosphodiesterase
VLLSDGTTSVLIDVTRDVGEQIRAVDRIDTVLLTHSHRDASGGLPQLRHWWRQRPRPPVPIRGHPKTLAALERRYARLDHCRLIPTRPGGRAACASWRLEAVEVAHARDPAVPTLAWKLRIGARTIVYASDVARPDTALERFAHDASLLVIDGATYRRSIFSHLRIDRDLPVICDWDVARILLTQIGRSAPPHEELGRVVARLCRRAAPAYDGLTVVL